MQKSGANYPDLAGKPVLVTGGGSGIGEAMTRAFAAQGARVAFIDIAAEASRALVDDLAAQGSTEALLIRACDVTSEAEVEALLTAAITAQS